MQIRQLLNQLVQSYIDVSYKLRIQFNIFDLEEVLIIKFNFVLLLFFHREVELFGSTSLGKAFVRALVVECKLAPQTRSPETKKGPSHASPSNVALDSSCWCTFHKANSHASVDCHVLQNMHPNKTCFT